jgi:ABC-2 type transport system permease protein
MAGTIALTEARVVRSEWLKFWSLRSRFVTLGLCAVGVVGIGALALSIVDPGDIDGPPAVVAIASTQVLSYALGVLGVLSASTEYASGLIRATFTAVPSRGPVLRAKALVLAAVAVTTVTATAVAAYGLGAITYDGSAPYGSLLEADLLRGIGAATLEAAGYALIGLALGFLLRNGAGAISALLGITIVLPIVVSVIPGLDDTAGPYLLSSVITAIARAGDGSQAPVAVGQDGLLPGPAALAVYAVWIAVPMAAAAVVTARRDA